MDKKAHNPSGDQPTDHWARLDAFLKTDPGDAGCDEAMEILDIYAELLAAGNDPNKRFRVCMRTF